MSGNLIVDGPGKQKVAAVPEPVREKIKGLALQESEPSPRELAMRFTDAEKYPHPLSLGPMAFQ